MTWKNDLNQQFSVNNKQFIYIIGNMLNRKCTETAPSFLHLNKTKYYFGANSILK